MPRLIHKPIPGIDQHVIGRFVDGEHLLNDDETRRQYLARLGIVLKDSDWLLLWYALMENHIHLALVAGNAPLTKSRAYLYARCRAGVEIVVPQALVGLPSWPGERAAQIHVASAATARPKRRGLRGR